MVYFTYICYSKVLCLPPSNFHPANQRFLCFSFVICSVFVAKEEKPENCNKLQQFYCIYLKTIVLRILNLSGYKSIVPKKCNRLPACPVGR